MNDLTVKVPLQVFITRKVKCICFVYRDKGEIKTMYATRGYIYDKMRKEYEIICSIYISYNTFKNRGEYTYKFYDKSTEDIMFKVLMDLDLDLEADITIARYKECQSGYIINANIDYNEDLIYEMR